MILYTMMPHELVYETGQVEDESERLIIENNGVPLLVSKLTNGQYEIIRVLSSDPKDYLQTNYSPGSQISIVQ